MIANTMTASIQVNARFPRHAVFMSIPFSMDGARLVSPLHARKCGR
jgi:hypothetical protein